MKMFSENILKHLHCGSHISERHLSSNMTQAVHSSEFSTSTNANVMALGLSIRQGQSKDLHFIMEETSDQAACARMDELRVLENIFLCGKSECKRKIKSKGKRNAMMVEIVFPSPTTGV